MSKPSERLQQFSLKATMQKLGYYFIGLGLGFVLGIMIGMEL